MLLRLETSDFREIINTGNTGRSEQMKSSGYIAPKTAGVNFPRYRSPGGPEATGPERLILHAAD